MKQVSKEAFFAPIFARNLDVHPEIVSAWPYTSVWTLHRETGRPVYGKTVTRVGAGKLEFDYFIEEPRP